MTNVALKYLWNNKVLPLVCLAVAIVPALARAQDSDPFQIDSGRWMSFERYTDYQKRGIKPNFIQAQPDYDSASNDEAQAGVKAPAATAAQTTAQANEEAGQSSAGAEQQAVAQPVRPLDLPELPGINKGFSISVKSTSDIAESQPSTASIVTKQGKTDFKLHEQDWQNAEEAARNTVASADPDDERRPINVRPSFLPNEDVTPVTAPAHPSARSARIAHALAKEPVSPPKVAAAPQADQVVCAAIDSYKKKQVEALQSDKQTLLALQSAIADLGLQKQLNFLTGAQGAVAPGAQGTTPH